MINTELNKWKSMHNKKSWGRYADSNLVSFLNKEYRNKKALDVGCGTGNHLKLLFELGFEVYGIDVDEAVSKINNDFSILKPCDFSKKIDFEDDFFDLILDFHSIQHSTNIDNTMNEVHRILKFGGLFISVWISERKHNFDKIIISGVTKEFLFIPFRDCFFSKFCFLERKLIQDFYWDYMFLMVEKI